MIRPAHAVLAAALAAAPVVAPLVSPALARAVAQNAAAPTTVAPAAPTRPAVPDAASLKEATKLVDGVYKDEVAAARTPELRRALAQKWLKAAAETQGDPAGRYVLLTKARDLAADAGDVYAALTALVELENGYDVDAAAWDAEAATKLGRSARSADDFKMLAQYLNGATTEAVRARRFDAARKLADAAAAAANRAGDPAVAKLTANRNREVKEVETAWGQAEAAAARPFPASPAEALQLGKLYALLTGDWPRGLPYLAAGGDPALKALADKDAAAPADGEGMMALADGWWDVAEKSQPGPQGLSALAKARAQLRAREWYERAAALVTGLPRDKAERRMKETEALAAVYGPKAAPDGAKPVEAAGKGLELPQGRFSREWKSPAPWVGKPEQVTVRGNRVSITNQGGTNVVCTDVEIQREKDGTLVVTWRDAADRLGYEVWSGSGKDITISRWDTKADKDAGRPAKRVGYVVFK